MALSSKNNSANPEGKLTQTGGNRPDWLDKLLKPFRSKALLAIALYGGGGIVVLLSLLMLVQSWRELQKNPTEESKRKFDAALSVISTEATIAAGVVLYLNFRVANQTLEQNAQKAEQEAQKARDDKELAERRLVVERFSKAVEMLGSENIHLRLGGIYALEGLANDSNPQEPDEEYLQVLEVLTAFVRESRPVQQVKLDGTDGKDNQQPAVVSSEPAQPDSTEGGVADQKKDEEIPPLPTDIQAVLTVLKRRKHAGKDSGYISLDLRNTDLRRANFIGADLEGVNLKGANLEMAYLLEANLERAVLYKTNLERVALRNANLEGAFLRSANLEDAVLTKANLERVDLLDANLKGVDLKDANLKQANLYGANLGRAALCRANLRDAFLTGANLEGANLLDANLQDAFLPNANLKGAKFLYANLRGVKFWDPFFVSSELAEAAEAKEKAKLNIQSAENWEIAHYDPEIQEWLGSLPLPVPTSLAEQPSHDQSTDALPNS